MFDGARGSMRVDIKSEEKRSAFMPHNYSKAEWCE
jgi:hypothetical protein